MNDSNALLIGAAARTYRGAHADRDDARRARGEMGLSQWLLFSAALHSVWSDGVHATHSVKSNGGSSSSHARPLSHLPISRDDDALLLDLGAGHLRFDGHGGVSGGGGSSRLLIDYPEPQRSEILDYLFLPKFGASMTQLKLEIGADSQTTQGVEPSHMHTRNDPGGFQRGWNWWLATEARRRNPALTLTGAQWGAPGWVAGRQLSSLGNLTNADNVRYVTAWVKGAKVHHNLTIDYVAVSKNEYPQVAPGQADYVLALRRSLDAEGLHATGLLAGDQDQEWVLPDYLLANSTLASAIQVLSCHVCRVSSASGPTQAVLASGKKIWMTEEHFNGATAESDWANAARLAKHINLNFLTMSMTATIVWTVSYSWYPGVDLGNGHLVGLGVIDAHQPWSGWYNASSPSTWVMAHTNQFATPGWRYLPPGQGSGFLPRVESTATSGSTRNVSCEACASARESAPRMLWGQYPYVSPQGISGLVQATSDGQCLTAVATTNDCSVGAGARVVTADCGGPCSSSTQHWRRVGRWLQLVKQGTNASHGGAKGLCLTAGQSSASIPDLLGVTVESCSTMTHGQAWGADRADEKCTPTFEGTQCLIELVNSSWRQPALPMDDMLVVTGGTVSTLCPANQSGVTCGGTKHDPRGDADAALCAAACCADTACTEWHWKKPGGTGPAGGCWRGQCTVKPTASPGWVGGTRGGHMQPPAPPPMSICCLAQQHPYRRQLDSPSPIDYGGSFVTLVSPDQRDFALVIETMDATAPARHEFRLRAPTSIKILPASLHVWQTTEHVRFNQLADVAVSRNGTFALDIQPRSILTITTTTGQRAAPRQTDSTAAPKRFPCRYSEDFQRLPLDSLAPFFADHTGTFAVAADPDGLRRTVSNSGTAIAPDTSQHSGANRNLVYTQQVLEPTDNAGQNAPHPIAIIGDSKWENVTVSAMSRFARGAGPSAMIAIGGRVAGGPTNPSRLWGAGVFLTLWQTGKWTITGGTSGTLSTGLGGWIELKLSFEGQSVHASINGNTVGTATGHSWTSGYVAIGCTYGSHSFDNVSILARDARCDADHIVTDRRL